MPVCKRSPLFIRGQKEFVLLHPHSNRNIFMITAISVVLGVTSPRNIPRFEPITHLDKRSTICLLGCIPAAFILPAAFLPFSSFRSPVFEIVRIVNLPPIFTLATIHQGVGFSLIYCVSSFGASIVIVIMQLPANLLIFGLRLRYL